MCGIFGIVSQEKLTDLELTQFQELRKDLSHRGPDGDGEIHLENIAIGMTRLAIVDEKQSGQPIWNKDRNICVFANCEIYNFKERSPSARRGAVSQLRTRCIVKKMYARANFIQLMLS